MFSTLPFEFYYDILFDSSNPKNSSEGLIPDNTIVSIYLSESDNESEIKMLIFLKTHAADSFAMEIKVIETKDYEESYKEFYSPFEIGKFFIIPTWEKESFRVPDMDKISLFLNPGMAFGTGHHETTKLMLERMSEIDFAEKSVLDVGTGSGILSIGACLLGAVGITAIDIDPNSIRAAEFNFSQNRIPPNVSIRLFEGGFDHPEVSAKQYDIVITNITFAVISNNISEISKIRTSHFLFSGIITEKREDSLKLFSEKIGGQMKFEKIFNDWMAIEWQR